VWGGDGTPARASESGFADALRRHRAEARLTQEELAEHAGLSVRTVSDLERAIHVTARRATVDRLASALGLTGPSRAAFRALGRGIGPPDVAPDAGPPAGGRATAARFVGRSDAHEAFADVWRHGEPGRRALLFAGEAGIGKSRLLAELCRDASADGALVASGRCDSSVRAPYRVLIDALRPHLLGTALRSALGELGPSAGLLALAAPELAELIEPVGDDLEPDARRVALLEAMAKVVTVIGAGRPVLLALDDLHVVDSTTLDVVDHLLRGNGPESLLVVGTYRDGEVADGHPLSALRATLVQDRLCDVVPLDGLDVHALAELVADCTGVAPTEDEARSLARHTGGNPFFVEEVLHEAGERGADLPTALDAMPDRVRNVVRMRLARLAPPGRDAITIAAVIGTEFDAALFETVADLPTLAGLDEAVETGFLLVEEDRVRFRHELTRTAVLRDIGRAARAELHWRIGESLEQLHSADREAHLEEIAHHLSRGAAAGDPARAAAVLQQVGVRQFRALAFDEAVASYSEALKLMPARGESARRRFELFDGIAEAHFWRDDPEAMRAAALGAAQLARDLGDPEELARSAIIVGRWNRGGEVGAGVAELLDEAEAALGPADSPLRSQLLAMRAYALQGAARGFDTRPIAAHAVDMARRCDDTDALVLALTAATYTEDGTPDLTTRRRLADELGAVATKVTRPDYALQYKRFALRARAPIQLAAGDRRGYEATRDELEDLTAHMRARFVISQICNWDASIAAAEGRFADAEERSAEALRLSERPDAQRAHLIQSCAFAVDQGREEAVLDAVAAFTAGNPTTTGYAYRAGYGTALAAVGRTQDARAVLDELGGRRFARLVVDHQAPTALRWVCELIAHLRDEDAARAVLPVLEPYGGQILVGFALSTIEAAADRSIGQLLAVLGAHQEADRRFACASRLEAGIGFAALQARTDRWWSDLLVRVGDDRGPDLARATAARAAELGMARLATEAAALTSPG